MAEAPLILRPISPGDLPAVDAVFDDLRTYALRVDGVPRRADAAAEFVNARPPGRQPRDKRAFVALVGDEPVGLLDLVDGHPEPGTVFLGLLAVRERRAGAGLGRALFTAAERYAADELHARTLRLAVVETNPVLGFWERMGFRRTGETRPYRGEVVRSRLLLLEKPLWPARADNPLPRP